MTPEQIRKERNHNNYMKWRAKKKGVLVYEMVKRLVVAERDGWVCQLCSQPISKQPKRAGQRLSLDHITPLSKGGSHTYENTQAAHVACNKEKADKCK